MNDINISLQNFCKFFQTTVRNSKRFNFITKDLCRFSQKYTPFCLSNAKVRPEIHTHKLVLYVSYLPQVLLRPGWKFTTSRTGTILTGGPISAHLNLRFSGLLREDKFRCLRWSRNVYLYEWIEITFTNFNLSLFKVY